MCGAAARHFSFAFVFAVVVVVMMLVIVAVVIVGVVQLKYEVRKAERAPNNRRIILRVLLIYCT